MKSADFKTIIYKKTSPVGKGFFINITLRFSAFDILRLFPY